MRLMPRPTPLRVLGWLVLALALLYGFYLATTNALLNSAWGRAQLERSPRLTLEWERAWTLFPGHLEVIQPRLVARAAERRVTLEADHATLRVALLPLLERKVEVRSLEAEGIRQVGLDAYRLRGSGTLRLAGARWHAGELAAERIALQLDDAIVLHGDTPLVDGVALSADLNLTPMRLAEHRGAAAARFVSGTLTLAGRSDAYDVFNPYLAALGWLAIDGRGDLTAEIALDGGEVQPGSRLRLDSPRLSVRLDERHWLAEGALYEVQGAGAVDVEVQANTRLSVRLDDISMSEAAPTSSPRPLLVGEGFRLALVTSALSLHSPPEALQGAELRWQNAEAADISAFGRYLPPPVPLTLEGGSARLQGGLRYDAQRLSGGFDLAGEAIAVRLAEQSLVGRLDLHLPIAELDMMQGTLDVSGARFDLAAAAPGETQPLSTSLELPSARFRSPPTRREPDDVAQRDREAPWQAELTLRGQVANLGVLDPFLAGLFDGRGLALQGGGRLEGELQIRDGQPLPGSRLDVRSEALGARLLGFHARGDGRAHLLLGPGVPHPAAHLELDLGEVALTRESDQRRLFEAERLALVATADASDQATRPSEARVEWQGARIPDVAVLDAYLPDAAPLSLHAGQARSEGQLAWADGRGQGRITLAGEAITGRLLDEAFHGELAATLALRTIDPERQHLDLSGSRLDLSASSNGGEPLRTLLVVRQAHLQGGFDWPGDAPRQPLSGTLRLDGLLDRLGFLNAFLPDEHGLAIAGGGRVSAELHFAEGEAAPGSRLDIRSERLTARFLHYEAFGDGSLTLEVADPGATLELSLPRFGLRRQASAATLVEGRLLEIHSRARQFALPDGLRTLSTRIDMPHVTVPSLAALNDYLPEGGGLTLLDGRAELAARLRLDGMAAEGTLSLHAPQARLAFDEQTLGGGLSLEARLTEGDLATRRFNVSGSRLSLSDVRLADSGGSLAHGWWARLALPQGQVHWEAPLRLDARLDLAMRDSGLLVNLFVDAARERRWLRDRLTLGEVHGEARLLLEDNAIRLENLAVHAGDRLELLANLALRDSYRQGRAFARYGPLQIGIELDGEQRRWQLRNAREWYAGGLPASELTLPEAGAWFERLDTEPR